MNRALIGSLVGLRYKLLWAKTRSRNGKIALFMAGYLLLVCVVALLAAGGFGAGIVAVRSGKAEKVAQAVLTALSIQALMASVLLGFGVNAVFSDYELRRYPATAADRRIARHLIGILDPFGFLILALELGLAFGLYVLQVGSFWMGTIAVLLLIVANYLAARVVSMYIDRLMQRKSGSFVVMAFIIGLAFLPSAVAPLAKAHPEIGGTIVSVLRFTPGFGAAAAATHWDIAAWNGLGLVALWIAALAMAVVALERRPPPQRAAETGKVSWGGYYERIAALFAPRDAPFVAYWLRFYMRNNRFRTFYLLTLPVVGFLTLNSSRRGGDNALFQAALGTFPIATFLATARMMVNQYGYVGGGFRRFFLLPTAPAASLRAGSYASLLLGSLMIPLAALAWVVFAPVPFDLRMLVMLLASGFAGLSIFHALGLWVTLLNPRRGNYYGNFGNDLSLMGNIVLIGGVLVCFMMPQLLRKVAPWTVSPASWWLPVSVMLAGMAFYWASLVQVEALFGPRREKLLAVVEGRD